MRELITQYLINNDHAKSAKVSEMNDRELLEFYSEIIHDAAIDNRAYMISLSQ